MRKPAPKASACDKCRDPGICCRAFFLSSDDPPWSFMRVDRLSTVRKRIRTSSLPFKVIGKTKHKWVIGCPLLGKDGRCADYERRPALCREFKPGEDTLCCMSKKHAPFQEFEKVPDERTT